MSKEKYKIGERFNPYKKFNGLFIPEQVAGWDKIGPARKLVYGSLCRFAGKDGKCWPSFESIAKQTGLSSRSVKRCINDLLHYNLITKSSSKKTSGTFNSNSYGFLWNPIFDEALNRDSDRHDHARNDSLSGGGDKASVGSDNLSQGSDSLSQGSDNLAQEESHRRESDKTVIKPFFVFGNDENLNGNDPDHDSTNENPNVKTTTASEDDRPNNKSKDKGNNNSPIAPTLELSSDKVDNYESLGFISRAKL